MYYNIIFMYPNPSIIMHHLPHVPTASGPWCAQCPLCAQRPLRTSSWSPSGPDI